MNKFISILLLLYVVSSCVEGPKDEKEQIKEQVLPFYGPKELEVKEVKGEKVKDTIYHKIPPFAFLNQDSVLIRNVDVEGHIYVADFFFTHCPSICPTMTKQMKRLSENTQDIPELMFLSHTIDPKRDTLKRLKQYRDEMGIDNVNWHFLRGTMDYTYDIGKNGYLINADEDEDAEGGYLHSEHFVLVDRYGHIRGMYEGTDPDKVDQLESDIRKLIKEEYGE